MYDQDLEGLDAVGKLSATILSALLSHQSIAQALVTNLDADKTEAINKAFAQNVVALAKAIADEIIAAHQQTGDGNVL